MAGADELGTGPTLSTGSFDMTPANEHCEACGGEMLDRGVLGGLYWGQCQSCGLWTHRRPAEDEVNRGIDLNRIDRSKVPDAEGETREDNDDE